MYRFLFLLFPLIAQASPVPYRDAYAYIVGQEGYRSSPYRDKDGWTVGVGHNLTAHAEAVKPYSKAQIKLMFDRDLTNARRAVRGAITDFDDLPWRVQLVCISLCWTVGPTGFYRFHAFRRCLSARDYHGAARALERSIWSGQVPSRASTLIRDLESVGA